jgi:hypothetical protein
MTSVNKLWAADVSSRLFSKRRFAGDCWEWTGGKQSTGYGMIKVDGTPQLVHRLAAELFLEGYDGSQKVSQLPCQNKLCFNPEHLVLNAPRKAANYEPKLTQVKAAAAQEFHSKGMTIGFLAVMFGCSYSAMWQAVNGITWRIENADNKVTEVLS